MTVEYISRRIDLLPTTITLTWSRLVLSTQEGIHGVHTTVDFQYVEHIGSLPWPSWPPTFWNCNLRGNGGKSTQKAQGSRI